VTAIGFAQPIFRTVGLDHFSPAVQEEC
jgi:hypothetical protein